MTVKQLMKKLKSIPEDYEVTIFNTDMVINGTYKADEIDINEDDKQVEISSKHKHWWNFEKQRWEK